MKNGLDSRFLFLILDDWGAIITIDQAIEAGSYLQARCFFSSSEAFKMRRNVRCPGCSLPQQHR